MTRLAGLVLYQIVAQGETFRESAQRALQLGAKLRVCIDMPVKTPEKTETTTIMPAQTPGAPAEHPVATASEQEFPQKRRSRRVKMQRPVRVRPSEPRDEHFEDLITSINASKEGIYFHSRRKGYYKGLRVFVTFPYTSGHDPMNCDYVAEVVRVEDLPNGRVGVAVELKMSLNYGKK